MKQNLHNTFLHPFHILLLHYCQNLSFVKDILTYGEKMAWNGRTKDTYKETFVCIKTLQFLQVILLQDDPRNYNQLVVESI